MLTLPHSHTHFQHTHTSISRTHPHVLSLTHHACGLTLTCMPTPAHTYSSIHTCCPLSLESCAPGLADLMWGKFKGRKSWLPSEQPSWRQEGKDIVDPARSSPANSGTPAGRLLLWASVSPSVQERKELNALQGDSTSSFLSSLAPPGGWRPQSQEGLESLPEAAAPHQSGFLSPTRIGSLSHEYV